MSELTLFILRMIFLALLWVFVFAIVYALRSDLFGQRVRRLPAEVASVATFPTPTPPTAAPRMPVSDPLAAPSSGAAIAHRLVITAGTKEGLEITLPADVLTIGRAGDSGLVIRDDYTSTHHARLVRGSDGWVLHDLDSTNGTFVDGKRVIVPLPLPANTTVTIGTTSFELRR